MLSMDAIFLIKGLLLFSHHIDLYVEKEFEFVLLFILFDSFDTNTLINY